ncbi:shikimate kinase [Bacillus pinisoli]|uniref:shikimate kinase n=1 Tax=Bacillus pinisoli TaxID=2901866 RepID=UPI001FF50B9C|nr:shikimate kinase [Bacillus pinisoli]
MNTIFLTGFMGSGKSTIGRELSNHLQLPVIDTDEQIERETGISIREIFSTFGESYFRDLESKTLFSLPTTNLIVTTGGGMVIRKENREWMRKNGTMVYLQCDFDVIWSRLEHDQTRPLVVNSQKEQIKHLYLERQQYYEENDFFIDTARPLQIVVEQLAQMIKSE